MVWSSATNSMACPSNRTGTACAGMGGLASSLAIRHYRTRSCVSAAQLGLTMLELVVWGSKMALVVSPRSGPLSCDTMDVDVVVVRVEMW
jgi:hypothetical protein